MTHIIFITFRPEETLIRYLSGWTARSGGLKLILFQRTSSKDTIFYHFWGPAAKGGRAVSQLAVRSALWRFQRLGLA